MTITAMVKKAKTDARAMEEIKTTALLTVAWITGCAIGVVGGLVIFG